LPAGGGLQLACLVGGTLLGFVLLRRRKPKEKEAEGPAPTEERDPEGEASFEDLLSRAAYPIQGRGELLESLGGAGSLVSIGERRLPAEEVADRCLTRSRSFASPEEVLQAFQRSSWAATILSSVNLLPFPIRDLNELRDRLKGRFVDGAPALDLLPRLNLPIGTPSELLSQLLKARGEWHPEDAGEDQPQAQAPEGTDGTG